MEPILTWNGLFGEARERKLRLVHLREDEYGYFHACWCNATTVFKEVDRRAPFTAAHDAFMAAIGVTPVVDEPTSDDLFG